MDILYFYRHLPLLIIISLISLQKNSLVRKLYCLILGIKKIADKPLGSSPTSPLSFPPELILPLLSSPHPSITNSKQTQSKNLAPSFTPHRSIYQNLLMISCPCFLLSSTRINPFLQHSHSNAD